MSADIIQAQYDNLETIAGRFGNQAEAHSELHSRIARCVQALQQGGWEGEGGNAFFSEMEGELFPAMQRLADALEEARLVTLEIKNIIHQAEKEAASVFGDNTEAGVAVIPSTTNAAHQDNKPDLDNEFKKFKDNRQPYTTQLLQYPHDGVTRSVMESIGYGPITITDQEAAMLDKLNPRECVDFGLIYKEAFDAEEDFSGTGENNDGIPDAFRHTYWSARLTQKFGADWATRYTGAHESRADNLPARDFMDRWNNSLGIRIAQQNPNALPKELASLIEHAIHAGEGVYIPGADQYPIDNSPERDQLAENGPLAYTNRGMAGQDI